MVAVCNNPDDEQTSLINERFRTQLNSLKLSDTENIIIAEMIIPPEVGGFTIREAALFDDAGVCMAVANVPETYKPALAEGSGVLPSSASGWRSAVPKPLSWLLIRALCWQPSKM
jgi:phage-related tail fiber protein